MKSSKLESTYTYFTYLIEKKDNYVTKYEASEVFS